MSSSPSSPLCLAGLHEYDSDGDQSSDGDSRHSLPIIYSEKYDISFYKLERLHPFDCQKWGKVARLLKTFFQESTVKVNFVRPRRAVSDEQLLWVHSRTFVSRITKSRLAVARAAQVPLLALLPMRLVRRKLLRPLRWQVAGSALAGFLALTRGWAVNIGGGFHHCCHEWASGFCLFADISLLIKAVHVLVDPKLRVLIVDLDAHQGNGHERDILDHRQRGRHLTGKEDDDLFYVLDMFNPTIFPRDELAKEAIDRLVELRPHIQDEEYLSLLSYHLVASLDEFRPHLVVYNAGTDILRGDPLGGLDISVQGVVKRDEIVFTEVRLRNIPIAMLTSGGYQRSSAATIAASIRNLFVKGLIK